MDDFEFVVVVAAFVDDGAGTRHVDSLRIANEIVLGGIQEVASKENQQKA